MHPESASVPPGHKYQQTNRKLSFGMFLGMLAVVAFWAALIQNDWIQYGSKETSNSGLLSYCRCTSISLTDVKITIGSDNYKYFGGDESRTRFQAIRIIGVWTLVWAFLGAVSSMFGKSTRIPLIMNIFTLIFGTITALIFTKLFGQGGDNGGSFIIFVLGFSLAGLAALGTLKEIGNIRRFGHLLHVISVALLAVAVSTNGWTDKRIRDYASIYENSTAVGQPTYPDARFGVQLWPDSPDHSQRVDFRRGLWEVCRCAHIDDNCHIDGAPIHADQNSEKPQAGKPSKSGNLFEADKCDKFDASRGLAFISGLLSLVSAYLVTLYLDGGSGSLISQAGLVNIFGGLLATIPTGLYAGIAKDSMLSNSFGCFIFGWGFALIGGLILLSAGSSLPRLPKAVELNPSFYGLRTFLLVCSLALYWLSFGSHQWQQNLSFLGQGNQTGPADGDISSGERGLFQACTCKNIDVQCQINTIQDIFSSEKTCTQFNIGRILIILAWIFHVFVAANFFLVSKTHPRIVSLSVLSFLTGLVGAVVYADIFSDDHLDWSFSFFIVAIFCSFAVAAGIMLNKPAVQKLSGLLIAFGMCFYVIAIGGAGWTKDNISHIKAQATLPAGTMLDPLNPADLNMPIQFTRSLWNLCECEEISPSCEGRSIGIKLYDGECTDLNAVRALGIAAAVLVTIATLMSASAHANGGTEAHVSRIVGALCLLATILAVTATIIFGHRNINDNRSNTSSGYAIFIGGWVLAFLAGLLSMKPQHKQVQPTELEALPKAFDLPMPVQPVQPTVVPPLEVIPPPMPDPIPQPVVFKAANPFEMNTVDLANFLGGAIADAVRTVQLTGDRLLAVPYLEVEEVLGGKVARTINRAHQDPVLQDKFRRMTTEELALTLGQEVSDAVISRNVDGPMLRGISDEEIKAALGSKCAKTLANFR